VRDGLRLALTTLTVARVRSPRQIDRRTAGTAMSLAPLVGLALGLVAAGVLSAVAALATAPLAGVLAIGTLAALTRGLHLDGLSDTVDGLGSYLPAEQARRVMKQPDVGALGMVAVVLVLAVQVTALLACVEHGRGPAALVLAVVAARVTVTAGCTRSTPAAAGSGLGASVAGTVPPPVPVILAVVTVAAGAAYGLLDGPGGAVRAALAVTAGLLVARVLRRHAVRRLGGVTGDVLGALVEVTTAVVLVGMALGS
jgi:adenosylcobinamide-GDP ribazoletransferase